jgi:hypothetical protein
VIDQPESVSDGLMVLAEVGLSTGLSVWCSGPEARMAGDIVQAARR